MNKEEFLKAIENVPKIDSINPISAYNSINVEDLANAVDRFKKVPTYDELLKENKKYKEVIDKLKEDLNLIIEYGDGGDASRYDKQYGEFAKNHLKYMDELLKEVE